MSDNGNILIAVDCGVPASVVQKIPPMTASHSQYEPSAVLDLPMRAHDTERFARRRRG